MLKILRHEKMLLFQSTVCGKGILTASRLLNCKCAVTRDINQCSWLLPKGLSFYSSSANECNDKCWKCKNHVTLYSIFCDKCQAIQKPPSNIDYFKLLKINASYGLNETELTNSYRRMQMILHPDKFSMRSSEEHVISEEYSTLVNKAYATLRNPWSRGVYFLKRAGVNFDEKTTVDDPIILLEVMERNEEVADAKSLDDLKSIELKNRKDMKQAITHVSEALDVNNLEFAKKELIKLRYFTNIDAKIGDKKLEYGVSE